MTKVKIRFDVGASRAVALLTENGELTFIEGTLIFSRRLGRLLCRKCGSTRRHLAAVVVSRDIAEFSGASPIDGNAAAFAFGSARISRGRFGRARDPGGYHGGNHHETIERVRTALGKIDHIARPRSRTPVSLN